MRLPALLLYVVSVGQTQSGSPPPPVLLPETTSEGTLRVSPDRGVAGEFSTWTVTYTVGGDGIATGGGVRVQLPDSWHAGPRNSANRLQASDPGDDHHVSSRCSRKGVRLRTLVESETKKLLVKHAKLSVDGRKERYVFVVRVIVEEGRLERNDEIAVTYGDRSGGSRGYRAAAISTTPEPVLVALDADGSGRFRLHTSRSATLVSLPGRAVEMLFHLPTCAAVSSPVLATISIIDGEDNPATHPLNVLVRTVEGEALVSPTVMVESGYVRFPVVTRSPGVVRLEAVAPGVGLSARSNPLEVLGKEPRLKIYWGDLHSHTHFSWDGVGRDNFRYARYISALDFYAMTDHSVAPLEDITRGLSRRNWVEYTKLTENHHAPGEFVTLHAYECSFGKPYGHHNVFFRGRPGPLFYPTKSTLPEVWSLLKGGEALTIPHHTGKFPAGIEFEIHHPLFRRNFEIYSAHGLSESYDPAHPLAFEQSKFTADSRSLKHPSFAQDAWERGLRLSTIASSDDHHAHPGQTRYGLVAVRAPELTRDAIFQALFDRRTYATTGARITLDFHVNRRSMGSTVATTGAPEIRLRAIGTDVIEWAEVLRYQPPKAGFRVVRRWEPRAAELRETFRDEDGRPGAIYYARLRQRGTHRGRVVMAWSSPVWTVDPR